MTDKKVTVEMDVFSAAAVRQVLYKEQERYTYDPACVPERISDIRSVIQSIDDQIEAELGEETND